ncbi:MAG: MarC family protein [Arcobacter sp.]|jgi:multiple antibiotic resistance protein|uniref:MarC family protein n=3 Tax=Arcobacter TaxID=28196 RepID=UPI000229666F|nr:MULTISPECIES: MarC family protein [unclassified Arcobacter]MDY3201570.1 MarC family protein [Arcobacter sp.]BAK74525.1 multiple antibiotic resistance protein [Arcobacter sp. L]
MDLFISTFLKMFFIMTPFFVLSVFLTVTNEATIKQRKALAIKVTISVVIASMILLFFGKNLFSIFGITLDAFRIGAGALLFITAVELVKGNKDSTKVGDKDISQLAVVPLSIPVTIGPGTIGILLVMGATFENTSSMLVGSLALICAVLVIGIMLYSSSLIEKIIGKHGLLVISKITGLFLAALSAQIVFTGIKNFLGL